MGLRDDLDRYRKVGEQRRDDLADFIQYGDLGQSRQDEIRIPIKIVELPAFEYDQRDVGGVGQGDAEEGDAVGRPQDGDGDGEGDGEPGEGEGEHGYYEMDPEEFAEELEEEFELHLEPKGKAVVEEKEGDMTDVVRSGPRSTLDLERMFKRGLRRKLASQFDPEYVREALRVEGMDAQDAFSWARDESINVSKRWLEETYAEMEDNERTVSPRLSRSTNRRSSSSTYATSRVRWARKNANSSNAPSRLWTGTSRASTRKRSSST